MSSLTGIFLAVIAILCSEALGRIGGGSIRDLLDDFTPTPAGSFFNSNGSDFNILRNLMLATGLENWLDYHWSRGMTLFAPTDDAFMRTAQDLGISSLSEEAAHDSLFFLLTINFDNPVVTARDILQYHMVWQELVFPSPSQTENTQTLVLDMILQSNGISRIGMTLTDRNPYLPDPTILKPNIEASNGVIHVIDRLLIPDEWKFSRRLPLPSIEESSPEYIEFDTSPEPTESQFPELKLPEESIGPSKLPQPSDEIESPEPFSEPNEEDLKQSSYPENSIKPEEEQYGTPEPSATYLVPPYPEFSLEPTAEYLFGPDPTNNEQVGGDPSPEQTKNPEEANTTGPFPERGDLYESEEPSTTSLPP